VTVGDELLAGETENTNGTWLAGQLDERGARAVRLLTIPDAHDVIVDAVAEYAAAFDAVLVTGGLGATHDDVTVAAVADATGRGLAVDDDARELVVETAAAYRDDNPDTFAEYDLSFDADAWATRPAGSRVVENRAGLAPGCVVEPGPEDDHAPVYVFPGPPDELKATFGAVADEFGGRRVSETLWTDMPEAAVTPHLEAARRRFEVTLGSYPGQDGAHNRVRVTAEDRDAVVEAVAWLRGRLDVVDGPEG